MRRELKIGVLVLLSTALVAAVFVGKVLSSSDAGLARLGYSAPEHSPETASASPARADAAEPAPAAHSSANNLESAIDDVLSKGQDAAAEPLPAPSKETVTPPADPVPLSEETAGSADPATAPGHEAETSPSQPEPDGQEDLPAIKAIAEASRNSSETAAPSSGDTSSRTGATADDTESLINQWIAEIEADEASSSAAGKPSSETSPAPVSREEAAAGVSELDRLLEKIGEAPTASLASPSARKEDEVPEAPSPLDDLLAGSSSPERAEIPSPSTYTVEKGDSFWTIAQKVYGKGRLWKRIASANPGVNPLGLTAGTRLVIPPLEDTSSVSAPPSGQNGRTHVVRPGETLWDVAAAVYGDGTKWKLIAQANPSINPSFLKPGAVLVIPDEPSPGESASPSQADAPLPEGYRKHTIRPSDKLWNIAREYYGSGNLYRLILSANPDIKDPHNLPVGKTILIPPKPE